MCVPSCKQLRVLERRPLYLFSFEDLRLEVLFFIVHLISKTEELPVHDLDKLVGMLAECVDERVC